MSKTYSSFGNGYNPGLVRDKPLGRPASVKLVYCSAVSFHVENIFSAMIADDLWPLLLTWFNFNPNMDM